MDFERIRPAVEEINLSDSQATHILEICKDKKRKKNHNYWIPVATAAAIAVIALSPSFFINIIGAKSANDAECPEKYYYAENGNGILADVEDYYYSDNSSSSDTKASQGVCQFFKPQIYALVPRQFSSLVGEKEYDEFLAQSDLTKGMIIVQFVEYFGITREEFDAANKDENGEEIFNADIIYTFDREQIDEYYGVKTNTAQ